MNKHKSGKPIKVTWVDSTQSSGWHKHKKSNMRCQTVGHFYKEYKDRIVVAMNQSPHTYGDYIEIPKVAIKKIKRLK